MSKRVCKFFARGACLKGEQCEYSHDRKNPPVDICKYYQKGLCAYGSRCRYKHVKASQAHSSASSSANGNQSLDSDSVVASTTRGTSSWVPKVAKLSHSDKPARRQQCKRQNSLGNGDVGESSTAVPAKHNVFCKFAAANCPLGKECSLIHGDQCLYCRQYCLHPTEQNEREKHLNTCEKKEKYLQALKDSQEIECNVCLERVLSKPKSAERKFGLLPECDHSFCISCIRNWRNSAPTSGMDTSNTVRGCPVCRQLSYFVIPSTIWYSTKEEKKEIIDSYKAKCKLIDCKHFNFGNGNCPFGASCFYKHTVKPGSYTWKHDRPPPRGGRAKSNGLDMYDMVDMLSEFDLESGEYYSIIRDSEFFTDMDPFEMMALSGLLGSGSGGSRLCPFDSDDEVDIFRMAVLSDALAEDSDYEELNPVGALLSGVLHSDMSDEEDY